MRQIALILALTFAVGGCCTVAPQVEDRNPAGTQPADIELRDALRQLTKLHNDRLRLAGFVGIPLIHKIDKPLADFIRDQKKPNEDLLAEYEKYGESKKADLTFSFTGELFSQSQKRMEAMQGDAMLAAKNDFSFYVLMFSFMDYTWGQSLLERTLKQTKNLDPALKTILEKDLKMHQETVTKLSAMIKTFKGS